MPIQKRLGCILIVMLNGFMAWYLGSLALLTAWLWLNPIAWTTLPLDIVRAWREPFLPIAIASGAAGVVLAPFLIRFLEFRQSIGILIAVVAGIVYTLLTAWLAAVISIPMIVFMEASPAESMTQRIVSLLAGIAAAAFAGGFLSIMYLHIIVIGGALVGILNHFLVRRFLYSRNFAK